MKTSRWPRRNPGLTRSRSLFGALVGLCIGTANAHHAPALYDNDRLMSIDSEVLELSYRFPHSRMRVRTADGVEWTISLAPPDVSERQGKKEALLAIQPGEQVIVFGWPHKIKRNEIRSHKLVFADGRVIEGAFNSLYQPRHQKELKKLLANPDELSRVEQSSQAFSDTPIELRAWLDEHDPMTRLALDVHSGQAFFIGIQRQGETAVPGIKDHLTCLSARYPTRVVSTLDDDGLDYVKKRNEWLARYLEGQLEICD